MSGVFGGGYEELSHLTGTEGVGPDGEIRRPVKVPGEPHEGVVIAATLGRIERELRRLRSLTAEYGRQFVRWDGAVASGAGLGLVVFEGPRSGADWYVERVTVSVAGASAAGLLLLYEGSQGNNQPDESQLIDALPALSGNSPSRGVLDGRGTPYFIYGGAPLVVALVGVVAASPVFCRLQGREVLSGTDPALHSHEG